MARATMSVGPAAVARPVDQMDSRVSAATGPANPVSIDLPRLAVDPRAPGASAPAGRTTASASLNPHTKPFLRRRIFGRCRRPVCAISVGFGGLLTGPAALHVGLLGGPIAGRC